jgi:glutathione S-transferase
VQGPAPDFDKSCWFEVKDTVLGDYPFANLPYLIDGEIVVTQSNAILRYVARKADPDLLGCTPEEAMRVDIMLEEGMDLRNGTVGMAYGPAGGDYEAALPAYEEALRDHLAKLSRFLGYSPYFAGENLTVCDFPLYELLDQNELMVNGVLSAFPNLKAFHARFAALAAIKHFLASDRCITFPCNNQHSHTTQKKIC